MKNYVVHCKRSEYDVYISRPSSWGNPFSHLEKSAAEFKVQDRDEAVSKYREWLLNQTDLMIKANEQLKGKVLACWCAPQSCHGDVLAEVANATLIYRPVGLNEWKLIQDSDYKKFPPRLPEQPIFYPVCNFEYAKQISEQWNKSGHVVRCLVNSDFMSKYETHIVGSKIHEEWWIPAEELEDFNDNIYGNIQSIMDNYSCPGC